MATTTVYGAQVTKVRAGGSGDNYIADGYIKSVEKIWIDSYQSSSDLSTNTTIVLAALPSGKKVTSIELTIETLSTQTNGQITLGTIDDSDKFMAEIEVNHNLTYSTISWPSPGLTDLAGTQLDQGKATTWPGVTDGSYVVMELNDWTMTYATITSIVRYT